MMIKMKKISNLERLSGAKFDGELQKIKGGAYVLEFPGWKEWSDKTGDHDCTNNGTDCTDLNSPSDAIRDSSSPTIVSEDSCE